MKIIGFAFIAVLISFPGLAQKPQWVSTGNEKPAFVENKGQVTDQNGQLRPDVKYIYHVPGFKLILKENSFSYELYTITKSGNAGEVSEATAEPHDILNRRSEEPDESCTTHRVDVSLAGANAHPQIIAEEQNPARTHYYLAHTPEEGVTYTRSFNRLTYKNIYPNIDFVFYAKEEGSIKYDIIVHPGGRPEDVKFVYEGMQDIALDHNILSLQTAQGSLTESIPLSYIKETGEELEVQYALANEQLSFEAQYDRSRTLVIDPKLEWATYIGNYDEYGDDIATDIDRNVYLAGYTRTTSGIATSGAYQSTFGGLRDLFIIKFDSAGKRIWGTYVGGERNDGIEVSITIDDFQNIYIGGHTVSTTGIASSGAYQTSLAGTFDGFFAKFDTSGIRKYASYYGGTESDYITSVVTDQNGNLYLAGHTQSTTGIASADGYKTSNSGNDDGFIAKFDSTGKRIWATYYGGPNDDDLMGIDIDGFGYLYVAGATYSKSGISTPNSFQPDKAYKGGNNQDSNFYDAYLVKFDTSGSLIWGTYLGDIGEEISRVLKCTQNGYVYLCGSAGSSPLGPNKGNISTPNAFKTSYNVDAFVSLFDSSGNRKWCTYYGGSPNLGDGWESMWGANVDLSDCIYITGGTSSTTGMSSFGTKKDNDYSCYIAKFDIHGNRVWGDYFGGNQADIARAVIVDQFGTFYITGDTRSKDIATPGSFQDTYLGGIAEAFLAKFSDKDISVGLLKQPEGFCLGESFAPSLVIHNLSPDTVKNLPVTYKLNGPANQTLNGNITIYPGETDTITFNAVTPGKAGSYTAYAYIASRDSFRLTDTTLKLSLEIYPVPNAAFAVADVCETDSVYFVNNSTIDNGTLTYTWDFGDSTFSTKKDPVHFYAKPGTYEVIIVALSDKGCSDSIIKTVNIFPKPQAGFSLQNTCFGDTVRLTNLSSILDNSTMSYGWDFGDGKVSNATAPTHVYSLPGVYTVKLRVTSNHNCIDSMSKQLTVYPGIKAGFSFANACATEGISFTNETTGTDTTGTVYSWDFGDGNTSNEYSPVHAYASAGTFEAKLIATTVNGCTDELKKTLRVFPRVSADYSADKTVLCEPGDVSFTNSSTVASGNFISIIDFGDGMTDTLITNTVVHHYPVGTYRSTLFVISDKGCRDSAKAIEIVVRDKPLADIQASATEICQGGSISFSNNTDYGTARLVMAELETGDGHVYVSYSNKSISHSYHAAGTFGAKARLILRSENPFTKDSFECEYHYLLDTIKVNPAPAISFSTQATASIREFTFMPSNTQYTSYEWDFGDGNTSTSVSPVHAFVADGNYQVQLNVKDSRDCDSTFRANVEVKTSGISEQETNGWKVYPNPAKTHIIVETGTPANLLDIRLYDVLGKEVFHKRTTAQNKIEIALPETIQPGLYLLRAEGNGLYSTLVVVER